MNLVQLKCPACGATLNVDDGLDTCFCQYCGAKIIISGQSDAAYRAKSNVKMTEKVSDTVVTLREKRYEQKERRREEQRKQQEKARKMLPFLALAFVILMGILFYMSNQEKKANNEEVMKLEAILQEVQQDYEAGNYDSALIKANQLHFSKYGTTKKQWDETRKNIIQMIETAKANSAG